MVTRLPRSAGALLSPLLSGGAARSLNPSLENRPEKMVNPHPYVTDLDSVVPAFEQATGSEDRQLLGTVGTEEFGWQRRRPDLQKADGAVGETSKCPAAGEQQLSLAATAEHRALRAERWQRFSCIEARIAKLAETDLVESDQDLPPSRSHLARMAASRPSLIDRLHDKTEDQQSACRREHRVVYPGEKPTHDQESGAAKHNAQPHPTVEWFPRHKASVGAPRRSAQMDKPTRAGESCGGVAPSLLGRLTGDAESAGDLCPRVSDAPQTSDGGIGCTVDLVGKGDEIAKAFHVAGGDAAAVSGHDSAGECAVVIVLYPSSRSAVSCQGWVDTVRACGAAAGHGLPLGWRGGQVVYLPGAAGHHGHEGLQVKGRRSRSRSDAEGALYLECGRGTRTQPRGTSGDPGAARSGAAVPGVPRLAIGAMSERAAGAPWHAPP